MTYKKQPLKVIAGTPDNPLIIGEIEIPCYVLEDETRVFSQRGVTAGVGLNPDAGFRVPHFMASKAIKPFVNKELMLALNNPVLFKNPAGGGNVYGYPATMLVDICNVVLASNDAGKTTLQQSHIVDRCDLLIRNLAKVGVIALVDEATGYQKIREQRALATILEKLIAKELQPWTKTFPFDFYLEICRLKNWPSILAVKRPQVMGHYTNDFVYDRLAPGILEELKRINPTTLGGYRKSHHHRWFTPELGHPKLKEHLAAVMALMRAAPNWDSFIRSLNRAFKKPGDKRELDLED